MAHPTECLCSICHPDPVDPPCPSCASLRARVAVLERFANAAVAFNDAMRGDYIDAKPEERVTCVVKMSSLGEFVAALDALKEG